MPAKLVAAVKSAGWRHRPRAGAEGQGTSRAGSPTRAPGWASRSTPPVRGRSSATSGSASSGCCASSRSSRSEHGQGASIGLEEVDAAAAPSAEHQCGASSMRSWPVDRRRATVAYLELRAQGEALPRWCRWWRGACATCWRSPRAWRRGSHPRRSRARSRAAPWAAGRRIEEARTTDAASLRASLEALSELELTAAASASCRRHGGAARHRRRSPRRRGARG